MLNIQLQPSTPPLTVHTVEHETVDLQAAGSSESGWVDSFHFLVFFPVILGIKNTTADREKRKI